MTSGRQDESILIVDQGSAHPTSTSSIAMTASSESLSGWRTRLFGSLRARLVWSFVIVLGVAIIISVVVVGQILQQRLDARIEAELIQEVQEVERLATGNDPDTGEPFAGNVERIFETALQRNVPAKYETILTFVDGQIAGQSSGEDGPRLADLPIETWRDLTIETRGRLTLGGGHAVEYLAVPFVVDDQPLGGS